MRWRTGARPLPITIFAVIVAFIGLFDLLHAITALDAFVERLRASFAPFAWTSDAAIVFASARFTIVLIPIAAVWGVGSPAARILVSAMAVPIIVGLASKLSLAVLASETLSALVFKDALAVAGVALLYTPRARAWFSQGDDLAGTPAH